MVEAQNFIPALAATTSNGQARAAAYQLQDQVINSSTTSLMTYDSGGQVLIIGDKQPALYAAQRISPTLHCTLLQDNNSIDQPGHDQRGHDQPGHDQPGHDHEKMAVADTRPSTTEKSATESDTEVLHGRVEQITGYLGHFDVSVSINNSQISLADFVFNGQGYFDLVLDLSSPPYLQHEILPPGYYSPGNDPEALQPVLDEMLALVGEFEKPKYFDFDPNICAHGRSGIKGCTRCLEACPTLAISSKGDKVDVDPYLCQGGGSCASVCPTGAIRFAYPKMSYLLDVVRKTLHDYRKAGGVQACLLFYATADADSLSRQAAQLPEYVLPFEIDEIGAVGMEAWFTVLAYGASNIVLWSESFVAPTVLRETQTQLVYAGAILAGMGYSPDCLQLLVDGQGDSLASKLQALPEQSEIFAATFAVSEEKRTNLRLALDHLYGQAPKPRPFVTLPAGAPFGEVWLDQQSCTLCMACVSQCPTAALLAGDDLPQLKFIEDNCIQCGLCARSCPEDAIGPSPRYLYESSKRWVRRVLYEEPPFRCIVCGKPFATQKMIDLMTQKLSQHWMFNGQGAAMRRIQMCENCRVTDLYRQETAVDVHTKV